MNLDKIKEFTKNLVQLDNLNQKKRILLSASLGWMIFIGYLTWWNGIKSLALDKSFRWDEWFWVWSCSSSCTLYFLFYLEK